MILKNIITNQIGEFSNYQGDDWIELTGQELNDYLLSIAKVNKIDQVLINRNNYIYSPVEYNGSTFVNSEKSGANLQAAYTYMDEPIHWLDINSNSILLTKNQIKDIIQLIITLRSYGYFKEAELTKAINDCTTIEELNNINIEF